MVKGKSRADNGGGGGGGGRGVHGHRRQHQDNTRSGIKWDDNRSQTGSKGEEEEEAEEGADDEQLLYDAATVVNLPAYDTKHLQVLRYRIPELNTTLTLHQSSTSHSTSSSLWLSSQVLAVYLLHTTDIHSCRRSGPRPATNTTDTVTTSIGSSASSSSASKPTAPLAIELGSGIGFISILLAHMGWDVLATDLEEVLRGVIDTNIKLNHPVTTPCPPGLASSLAHTLPGRIRRKTLDWTRWDGTEEEKLELLSLDLGGGGGGGGCEQEDATQQQAQGGQQGGASAPSPSPAPFIRLVLATDTLYVPHLVDPFWRVFSSLLAPPSTPPTMCAEAERIQEEPLGGLIALERRDDSFITSALQRGLDPCYGLQLRMICPEKLDAIVSKALRWRDREIWSGVEIWEVRRRTTMTTTTTTTTEEVVVAGE